MRITEIILSTIGTLGVLMSVLLIGGGNILTVIALTLLLLLHLLFGFAIYNGVKLRHVFKKASWESISTLKILGGIAAGLSVWAMLTGILYKVMIWPGANAMLQNGLFIAAITLLIALIKRKKSVAVIYRNAINRIVIYGVVALVCFVIPTATILDFKYRNYPEYLEAKKNVLQNPKNFELQLKERAAFDQMMEQRMNE
jgi:hypothetical protein